LFSTSIEESGKTPREFSSNLDPVYAAREQEPSVVQKTAPIGVCLIDAVGDLVDGERAAVLIELPFTHVVTGPSNTRISCERRLNDAARSGARMRACTIAHPSARRRSSASSCC
jgi:hypothetical protein